MKKMGLILLMAAMAAAMPCQAAPARVWEHIELTSPAGQDDAPVSVEATVRDGYLYVTLSRRAQIKLFTILGQTVSQAELPAGTSRLRIAARGIYILRAGDTTVRITI